MTHAAENYLILSASAGAGHLSAAAAIRDEFARRGIPGVPVLDVLEYAWGPFRLLYRGGYHTVERYAPSLLGCLYDLTDDVRYTGALRRAFQRFSCGRLLREVARRRPKTIIHTHFLSAELIAAELRAGRLDARQITVVTDYEVHRLWAQPSTSAYCVASHAAAEHLAALGAPRESIYLTGIPIRPEFGQPLSRPDARRALERAPDRRIIVLLCGGFPIGYCLRLLGQLEVFQDRADVVVITGRNSAIRLRLTTYARSRPWMHVLGFTERMPDWLRAADVVVSKPGGLTSAESLAAGAPLVLVRPIPGQETRNADVLLEHGAALKVNHPRLLAAAVERALSDADVQQALREGMRRLARPDAAARVVGLALGAGAAGPERSGSPSTHRACHHSA